MILPNKKLWLPGQAKRNPFPAESIRPRAEGRSRIAGDVSALSACSVDGGIDGAEDESWLSVLLWGNKMPGMWYY